MEFGLIGLYTFTFHFVLAVGGQHFALYQLFNILWENVKRRGEMFKSCAEKPNT